MSYDKIELLNTKDGIRVLINDEDLISLLHDYEKPFAEKEDSPSIAGRYSPVLARDFLSTSYSTDSDGDLILFDCECGVGGCWPMVMRIIRMKDAVVWSDFQQPFRDETSHDFWDYSNFEPFNFRTNEYDEQLSKLNK